MIKTNIIYNHRGRFGVDGSAPVEVRVTVNRRAYYINTGVHVRPREFKFGQIINRSDADILNDRVAIMLKRVDEIVNECLEHDQEFNIDEVRRRVKSPDGRRKLKDAEDIIIPVGVYPINYSEDYGTVQANPGVQGNGVLPSFYAQVFEDGSLVVPIWLLVDGTVEVSKDEDGNPHLEVNAFNSYGVPVHITYDGSFTSGVEDITSEKNAVTKQLKNAQLLIIRNGEVYNMLGTRVK